MKVLRRHNQPNPPPATYFVVKIITIAAKIGFGLWLIMWFFHELCHQDHAWWITFYLDSNLITNTLDTIEIVKRFAFGRKQNHGHSGIFQEGHAQGVVNLMLPPPSFPFPKMQRVLTPKLVVWNISVRHLEHSMFNHKYLLKEHPLMTEILSKSRNFKV